MTNARTDSPILKDLLSLEFILDNVDGTPEDFAEWHRFKEVEKSIQKKSGDDVIFHHPPYKGHFRYVLHGSGKSFVIVAARRKNGTYDIKDFLILDE